MSAAEDIGEVREELHAYLRTPHDMLPMRVRPARPSKPAISDRERSRGPSG